MQLLCLCKYSVDDDLKNVNDGTATTMSPLFEYDDPNWKTELLTCPQCGWQGTFNDGDIEFHEAIMDSSCPKCESLDAPVLAIVSYQTTSKESPTKNPRRTSGSKT